LVSRARVRPWFDEGDETLPTGYGLPAESDDAEEPDESEESDTWGDDEDGTVQLFDFDAASGLAPPELRWMPLTDTEQRIAVVDLSGMIVMPDMQLPGSGGPVIDPDEVIPVLEHVRETPQFGAVLLQINSPGGSALASEIIGEAIEDLKREKPVAAYCTDVGYYLASAADSIVCHRATVTGSIGVIVGKFSAPGIPEKLGVNIESIHEHDADTFTSLAHPLSDDLFERLGIRRDLGWVWMSGGYVDRAAELFQETLEDAR
ncbi:MAG: S49 family peptidase, partial [Bradymonadaceae bacterium]